MEHGGSAQLRPNRFPSPESKNRAVPPSPDVFGFPAPSWAPPTDPASIPTSPDSRLHPGRFRLLPAAPSFARFSQATRLLAAGDWRLRPSTSPGSQFQHPSRLIGLDPSLPASFLISLGLSLAASVLSALARRHVLVGLSSPPSRFPSPKAPSTDSQVRVRAPHCSRTSRLHAASSQRHSPVPAPITTAPVHQQGFSRADSLSTSALGLFPSALSQLLPRLRHNPSLPFSLCCARRATPTPPMTRPLSTAIELMGCCQEK